MELTLTIKTDNAALQTPRDLSAVLNQVAGTIRSYDRGAVFGGPVIDANGNTVGRYHGSCDAAGEEDA